MNTPLTAHIGAILIRDLHELKDELAEVPDHHLWAVMPGIINPIGVLVVHVCGNLRFFIGSVLGEDGYTRDREAEFAVSHLPQEALQRELDRTIEAIAEALPKVSAEQLKEMMPHTPPRHQGKTVDYFLIQLTNHLSRHRGQLNYLRRMLAAASTPV